MTGFLVSKTKKKNNLTQQTPFTILAGRLSKQSFKGMYVGGVGLIT